PDPVEDQRALNNAAVAATTAGKALVDDDCAKGGGRAHTRLTGRSSFLLSLPRKRRGRSPRSSSSFDLVQAHPVPAPTQSASSSCRFVILQRCQTMVAKSRRQHQL